MHAHWMKVTLTILAVIAIGFTIDRVLLWMEDRGWIYYRKRKPNITSIGTALFQIQAIIQPEKQHVADTQLEIKEDEDDDGDKGPKKKLPKPPEPL